MLPGVHPLGVRPLSTIGEPGSSEVVPLPVDAPPVDAPPDFVALIELYPWKPGAPPVLEWRMSGPSQVGEGEEAQYTIWYTGMELTGAATITIATGEGAATDPEDFTALSTVLTFEPGGVTSQTVAVSTIDDTLFEGSEDFTVTLAGQSSGVIVHGGVQTTIVDDEAIEWNVAGPSQINEGESGSYTVSYTGAELSPGLTMSVAIGSAGGTAASGTDFTALATVLTFTAGGATSKTLAVSTIEDTATEGTEDFIVTLSSPSHGTLDTSQVNTGIIDDDVLVWSLAGTTQITEHAADATYTVSYAGAALAPAETVTITVASGNSAATWPNATAGADYTALSTVLTFTQGGATEKTVAVSVIEDTIVEGTEDFAVTISGQSAGTLGTSVVNALIVDDDASNLVWSIAGTTQVTEAGSGAYTVSYTGVTLAAGQTASVSVASGNSAATWPNATAAADYTALATTLTFTGGGATQKTVEVSTIADTIVEGTEDFAVTLSAASIGSLGTSQVNTLVVDDDATSLVWNVVGASQITEGDAGNFTVNYTGVTLAAGQTATITVASGDLSGGDANAAAGTDYTALSTVLTFTGGGATQKTVAVSTIEDTAVEGTEDFRVTVAGQSIGTLGTSQVDTDIVDDDGGAGVSTMTYRGSSTSTSATVALPTGTLAGELALLFSTAINGSGVPSDSTPADWIVAGNVAADPRRRKVMAGVYKAGDIVAGTITGLSGDSTTRQILKTFTPDVPITGIVFVDTGGSQMIDTNPASEVIDAAAGNVPLIVFCGYASSAAVDPRTWSGSTPTEVSSSTAKYFKSGVFNSSPANITVDMDDEGNGNTLLPGYIEVS